MSRRFFVPELDAREPDVTLPPDEARHAGRVLRLSVGALVSVFDGRGHEWSAEVTSVARDRATLRLQQPITPVAETRIPVTLAISVLKGDKMDDVVRDAVMLGAAAILPVISARSEVTLAALGRGERVERWRRIAIASAKQCGRAVVPAVAAPDAFAQVLAGPTAATRLVLAEPHASAIAVIDLTAAARPSEAQLWVGPEGGWTEDELRQAETAGAIGLRLGARTLRADAVPLVALAALLAVWGEI